MIYRAIISLIIVAILGVGTWYFLTWANSPASQQVSVDTIASSTSEVPKDIATDFFATKVPAGYRIQTDTNPSNSNMVQFTAFDTRGSESQIGITSSLLPDGGLESVADYAFRLKRTDLYEQIPTVGFTADNPTFEKKDKSEVTVFVMHDNRYASIAITTAANSSDIASIRTLVAENWRWL